MTAPDRRRPDDETRLMRPGDLSEAAATMRSRGRYPRLEDAELSRIDYWDDDPGGAPPPIRDPDAAAWWARACLLVVALVIVLILCWACGVPRT
jgi:hypothetical protein